MRRLLRALGYEPRKYIMRRYKLRQRLLSIFAIDAIEGQIDCLVRSALK